MPAAKREIIYIDIEDEITSVIDKVVSAKPAIIALVPPKRATMLQSTVNMKLLKRRADQAGKKLVLVTSESGLLPLAAMANMHVAKTLQSKPYIPAVAQELPTADTPDVKENETTIGELAKATNTDLPVETLPEKASAESTDTDIEPQVEAKQNKSKKKAKSTKIPNFNTFRNKIMYGVGGVIVLIAGWWVMYKILPAATMVVKAETSRVNVTGSIVGSTAASADDLTTGSLQSELKQVQKTVTQEFAATGEKNTGNKAAGTITVRNCDYSDGFTLNAGTKFTDSSGKVFVSTAAVSVPDFSGNSSSCTLSGSNSGKADVSVEAAEAGDGYNLGPRSYTTSSISGKVDAQGGQMTGGTTKIVKVVSQGDIDAAKQKLNNQSTDEVKQELKKELGDKLVAVDATFEGVQSDVKTTPAVNETGDNGKVTATVTYKQLGIRRDSLKAYIEELAKKQYDSTKQKIFDDGIAAASIKLDKKLNDQTYNLSINTDIYVGPQIDETELAKQVTGKRVGEAEEYVRKLPGVRDVKASLGPFYVKKLPKPSKIKVTFDVQAVNKTP